jgi:hypothetical protein
VVEAVEAVEAVMSISLALMAPRLQSIQETQRQALSELLLHQTSPQFLLALHHFRYQQALQQKQP